MVKSFFKSVAFLVAVFTSDKLFGAIIVDQQQPVVSAGFGFGIGGNTGIQSVTSGVSGTLTGFELVSNGIGLNASIDIDVFVNVGSPLQVDANDFETTVTLTAADVNSFFFVDTSAAGILLNVGEQFTFGFTPQSVFDLGVGSIDSYSDGQFYYNGTLQTRDIAFRTYMDAVPEPSTFVILALGIGLKLTCRHRDSPFAAQLSI